MCALSTKSGVIRTEKQIGRLWLRFTVRNFALAVKFLRNVNAAAGGRLSDGSRRVVPRIGLCLFAPEYNSKYSGAFLHPAPESEYGNGSFPGRDSARDYLNCCDRSIVEGEMDDE